MSVFSSKHTSLSLYPLERDNVQDTFYICLLNEIYLCEEKHKGAYDLFTRCVIISFETCMWSHMMQNDPTFRVAENIAYYRYEENKKHKNSIKLGDCLFQGYKYRTKSLGMSFMHNLIASW